jgi:hypothetical protein
MKTKLAVFALACLVLTGCNGLAPLGQAFVRTTAFTGTAVGLKKHPEAKPEVEAASLIFCAAANNTNVVPDQILSTLEASGIGGNEWAWFIVNGALGLYTSVYESYGADVKNYPVLVGYLRAICDGMRQGLGAVSLAAKGAKPSKPLPPHLK